MIGPWVETDNQLRKRIERLERCMLSIAAMVSGEGARVGTAEELQSLLSGLGDDLAAMAEELS